MKRTTSHNQGFAAVEAILVIVILAVIGFVGWYVWHSRQGATETAARATTSTGETASNTPSVANPSKAVEKVKSTYEAYSEAAHTGGVSAGLESIKSDMSSDLYSSLQNQYNTAQRDIGDLVVCSEMSPSSFNASLDTSDAKQAVVDLVETFGDPGVGQNSQTVKVTVDLVDLKLTDITCP